MNSTIFLSDDDSGIDTDNADDLAPISSVNKKIVKNNLEPINDLDELVETERNTISFNTLKKKMKIFFREKEEY